eukprot:g34599.t1
MSAVVVLASSRLAKRWSSVRSVLMSIRVCASGPVDGGECGSLTSSVCAASISSEVIRCLFLLSSRLKLNMPPPLSAVGCNGASGNDAVDGVACSSSLSSFSESASNMYTSAELSSSHWSISVEVWHASLTWSTFGIVEVARQSPATWLVREQL